MNAPAKTRPEPDAPEHRWKILLVDDHPVVREGLAQRIRLELDLDICATCDSAAAAFEEIAARPPDLAIVDLSLPTGHGLDLVKAIHQQHPQVRLLVFSMHDEEVYGERALLSGAQGYVMKHELPDRVLEAIRDVLAGRVSVSPHLSSRMLRTAAAGKGRLRANQPPIERLSDRELEILGWLGQGLSVKNIATRLRRSAKTIETHRQRLKDKLQIKTNSELIVHAACWLQETSRGAERGGDGAKPPGKRPAQGG